MFEVKNEDILAAEIRKCVGNSLFSLAFAFLLGGVLMIPVTEHRDRVIESRVIKIPSKHAYAICRVSGEWICCTQQNPNVTRTVNITMEAPPLGDVYTATIKIMPGGDVEYCQPYVP